MKKVVCMLLVLTFFFGSVLPASASTTSTLLVVLPQGEVLDDTEMSEIEGEVAPWIIGGLVSGTTDAALKAVDNYLEGKRGTEILDGCGKSFVKGAVAGAITAPTKTVTTTVGILTKAKKVYDTSKTAISVGSGVASYLAGEIYDKITE